MGKTIAYLRASTDKQDLSHQKLEILEFARRQGLHVDEYIEITISSRKTSKQRRIDELVQMLNETDALIVTELSRLGRSTAEVIAIVNALVDRNIRLIMIKQNLDIHRQDMNSKIMITLFSLFAELERDMISQRTKEALAAKKTQGQTLGKAAVYQGEALLEEYEVRAAADAPRMTVRDAIGLLWQSLTGAA